MLLLLTLLLLLLLLLLVSETVEVQLLSVQLKRYLKDYVTRIFKLLGILFLNNFFVATNYFSGFDLKSTVTQNN
jgi:hypothetical protein